MATTAPPPGSGDKKVTAAVFGGNTALLVGGCAALGGIAWYMIRRDDLSSTEHAKQRAKELKDVSKARMETASQSAKARLSSSLRPLSEALMLVHSCGVSQKRKKSMTARTPRPILRWIGLRLPRTILESPPSIVRRPQKKPSWVRRMRQGGRPSGKRRRQRLRLTVGSGGARARASRIKPRWMWRRKWRDKRCVRVETA